ncbi:glycosyltransferase family 4 protein [Lutibacter sp. TH_r2]|uniref:glycosyltransferase family 4 protein n=1 Tax=Lutibacter sp. TH_r2 TaxID=3082083 RepID=UPI0029541DF1|nr:glycosyltransferase family 4 protein [Lutibacter sp. TH_r2]MDV7187454.1 glycosyltransferase family 4 protein [Lutibacter sp. TH_r2]
MHIVFITNEYPDKNSSHGGIGTFVQNLGRNLCLKGIEVSVIGIHKSINNVEVDNGVKVYRIQQSKAKFGKFLFNSYRIRKALIDINKNKPIDIIEGSELSFAFLPNKTAYKKVIRMHGGHHFFAVTLGKKPALWRSFQEKKSFSKADALIAVSNYVGETTTKLLSLKKSYKTIYNFIDLNRFNTNTKIDIVENSIVFIGTICEKKGVKELVDAFEIVKEKVPNATLHLIGRDWKSNEIPSYISFLKKRIKENILEDVKFYGSIPQDKIPSIIASAQICVYPSHMESFGLTVIEAMAMQKPIVFSNIPPFKELIKDKVSGLECNPFNSNDIANKVIDLLIHPSKAITYSENAEKEVNFKFNSEDIIQQNIQFYNNLIEE